MAPPSFAIDSDSLKAALAVSLTLFATPAEALLYYGRATTGAFVSQETHETASDGTNHNDFATISSRLYFQAVGTGPEAIEFVSDLRDKHDFFDKLDQERRSLTDANTLQVRQLAIRYPNRMGTFYASAGRFAVAPAGASYVDGAEMGLHLTGALNGAVFGGGNPRRPERSYLESVPGATTYGAYLDYQPRTQNWTQAFKLSTAFVNESYSGETDRNYLYSDCLYQWESASRLFYLLYFDFVPRTYLQNGSLTYQQALSRDLDFELSGLAVDVIEYRRRQSVREHLDPSPYHEVRTRLRYRRSSDLQFFASARYGKRESDGLAFTEGALGLNFPRVFSARTDLSLEAGYRDQFTHNGPYGRMGAGYYSRAWEFTLDIEGASENDRDGSHLTPITTELSAAYTLSREFLFALAFEYAHDEQVSILTSFLRLSYRFGNREIPPVRDGAPPTGRL